MDRDAIEKEILRAELREEEVAPKHLNVLVASFALVRPLGLHLNASNVILRIDEGGLAEQEGTLAIGDRIVTVNNQPCLDTAVKDLLKGVSEATFVATRLERAVQPPAPCQAAAAPRPTAPAKPPR